MLLSKHLLKTIGRGLLLVLFLNCVGIRKVIQVLHICTGCVLHLLLSFKDLCWIAKYRHYHQVGVDEVYSFVKSKKKKVWILYGYCKNSREILAVTPGKRSRKTVRELFKRLKDTQVDYWCTDKWEAFKEVFPKAKHLIGKKFTKAIEGVNTSLRSACKRLVRRTTAFSNKVLNHWTLDCHQIGHVSQQFYTISHLSTLPKIKTII